MELNFKDKISLEVQRVASRCLFVFFGPLMTWIFHFQLKYKAENLKEIRKRYRQLMKEADGPVLVCTNHLTLIDSVVQSVLFGSIGGHFLNFKSLPWNLPEKKNFYRKRHWRMICYLGKCIPVVRGGSLEEGKRSLSQMQYVLSKGDAISIFPEGKRSRDGRVDDVEFSYASGQILAKVPETKVLCVYMRGKRDGKFGDFPTKGEEFYLDMNLMHFQSEFSGRRKARDLSTQIIQNLKTMEEDYFSNAAANR